MDLSPLMTLEPGAIRCPYGLYEDALSEGITYDEAAAAFVVSRHGDAVAVLRDTDAFSSRAVTGRPIPPPDEARGQIAPLLLVTDEPEHQRKRALVARAFTPRQMKAWEPEVARLCDQLVEQLLSVEAPDFVRDFAAPLPIRVITAVLGVPGDDADTFRHWSEEVTLAVGAHDTSPERRRDAGERFRTLVDGLLDDAGALAPDSVLAVVAEAEKNGALTRFESVRLVIELIVAGNITTTDHLASSMLLLCSQPGLAEQLRSDPSLVGAFVEESLRLEAPVQGFYRHCTEDRVVGDVPVEAGSRMLVLYAAANRDGGRFPDPGTLRLDRDAPAGHLAFGFGAHSCLGAPLARMESRLAFETILARTSDFSVADPGGIEYLASYINHGPSRLPVRFTRAADGVATPR